MIWTISLLAIGLAAPADIPVPHDQLHYALGGLMNGPVQLDLDLVTGDFTLTDSNPLRPQESPTIKTATLTPAELSNVQQLTRSLKDGDFDSDACKRSRSPGIGMPPTMDAIVTLWVKVSGRVVAASANSGCWSDRAGVLANAALKAARRR